MNQNEISSLFVRLNESDYKELSQFYKMIYTHNWNGDTNEKKIVKHFVHAISCNEPTYQLFHCNIVYHVNFDNVLEEKNTEVESKIAKTSPILFNFVYKTTNFMKKKQTTNLLKSIQTRTITILNELKTINKHDYMKPTKEQKHMISNWIKSGQFYTADLKRIPPKYKEVNKLQHDKNQNQVCNKNFQSFSAKTGKLHICIYIYDKLIYTLI